MKKRFWIFCLILILIAGSGCSSKESEKIPDNNNEKANQLDELLVTDPVSSLLDDILGLQDLTSGNIINLHKYFNPLEEVLTYDITYDKSDGRDSFVENCKNLFRMGFSKISENIYEGSFEQYKVNIHFNEDDTVYFTVKISQVHAETVFSYIDNEYPDQLINGFPEGIPVFRGIKGIEYVLEDNTLSFERLWTVSTDTASNFIKFYEQEYSGNYDKLEKENHQILVAPIEDYVSIEASIEQMSSEEFVAKFSIIYDLDDYVFDEEMKNN